MIQGSERMDSPRHSAVVRVTHWITAFSFLGLLVSGILILIAHPRLYWGETGGVGAPSLIDLPIPFKIGYSGWGRYAHFLSAWVIILTGVVYLLAGLSTRHFSRNLMPARADLAWSAIWRNALDHLRFQRSTEEESRTYNLLQRMSYVTVVFVLFPLVIVTGFGMSPAIASVVPLTVNVFGGQQSARTLHFFVASLLVLFLLIHIAMVFLAGFTSRMRAMITGHDYGKERT
jgi:thiosulfate reductase cytochrome b subunit